MSIAKTAGKDKGAGTFCVSPEHISTLMAEDVRTMIAYLVMACGSGGDNTTTNWSAQAISKYSHMQWGKAKEAVDRLLELGIVARDDERSKSRHPVYKILENATTQDGQIWLPNTLIEGVDKQAENYPLRRVRESQDTMLLTLLLDLYANHDLPNWGGVPPSMLRIKSGEKIKINAAGGAQKIWGFDLENSSTAWSSLYSKHGSDGQEFWRRFHLLKSFGFLEESVVLLDSEDGDVLFSFSKGSEIDKQIFAHCEELCFDKIEAVMYQYTLPVSAHIEDPHLIGIYRLKFRPHTKRTAAWFARSEQINKSYIDQIGLKEIAKPMASAPEPKPHQSWL